MIRAINMNLLSERRQRRHGVPGVWGPLLLAVLFFGTSITSADAQSRWQQTVQVITPVVPDEITGALLDSLVQVVDRNSVPVRRTPDDEEEYSVRDLSDRLLDEGLDVTSANQMFITYRYEADARSFKSDIVDLQFIYRPVEYEDADVPILSVDAMHPIVKNMLVANGTRLESNEAVFEPFWDQLRMHQLEDGRVVMVGGKILRDDAEAEHEKQRILGIIRHFLY